MRRIVILLLILSTHARAVEFSARLTPAEVAALPAQREQVRAASDALLLVPDAEHAVMAKEPREALPYSSVCYVYVQDGGLYVQRFAVHVPDRDLLPFARRVGRFMALLWSGANRRFGTASTRLREKIVDIWLSRSGEAGGENYRNNLYLYDILAERTVTEWVRELAHEYGHYLLPGASGYTEPEAWANGVLGERLFMKWLRDDLRAGLLDTGEVPFVRLADLEEYCARQVTPLLVRMQASGPDPALLARRDRRAMDAYTALLLYTDETHGPAVLLDMLEFLPHNTVSGAGGEDFLSALKHWLDAAPSFVQNLPPTGVTSAYLPRGVFMVHGPGSAHTGPVVGQGATVSRSGDGWTVRVPSPGWRVVRTAGVKAGLTLRWERQAEARGAK